MARIDLMRVLITGVDGFVGKNLTLRLKERSDVELIRFSRQDNPKELKDKISKADFIFHLAGVNRTQNNHDFVVGNIGLTESLCEGIREVQSSTGKAIPVVYTSSIQASLPNDYGRSKRGAEIVLKQLEIQQGIPVHIFRLPNIFGKWCRPNYNSVVATFCYNTVHGLPIEIHDPNSKLTLVYIDDLIEACLGIMDGEPPQLGSEGFAEVATSYSATVGALADQITTFHSSRQNLSIPPVGSGFLRALYSTYISYLPPDVFSYPIPMHSDERGAFVEMLKTSNSGQFSFFTAHPHVTRGGHYHHTKTEKFLVIRGTARFKFRHMDTCNTHEIITSGDRAEIVETVPGWTHDITNIGTEEMVVMLWANEVFDQENPDTFAEKL